MDTLETPACRFFPDTTIAYINSFFCTAFHCDRQEFIGRQLLDHVPPAFHGAVRAISSLTPEQPTATLRFPILDPAGGQCWAIWNCKGEFAEEGSLHVVTAFARVITDDLRYRTALENLLQIANDPTLEYEERAHGILACGADYFKVDAARIVRLTKDRTGADIENFGIGEIDDHGAGTVPLEKSPLGVVLDAGPTIAISDICDTKYAHLADNGAFSLRGVLASEIYLEQRLHGAVIFGTHRPYPHRFADQHVQFCQLIAQWIGFILEQHQFVAELQFREKKYKQIFEYAPVMIYVLDDNDFVVDVNNSWLTTLGYKREEVIGKSAASFFAPQAATKAALEPEDSAHNLNRDFIAKDGSVVETLLSTPSTSTQGAPRLGVMINVTERNQVLQELTDIRKTLTQANEGLKRFNAIAAHDLQEPLRKIRLFGSLLKSALDMSVDPEVEIAIEKIIDAANRLTTLVQDLLQYSREGERVYVRQKINLSSLLDEAINDLTLSIEDTGAQIRIFDLPEVDGDPVPVQRIFANLILNALKYRREDRNPEVEIFARKNSDGKTEVIVRDNGVGLREGEESKIFEPFVRAHLQNSSGSGIGLAICKSIATGHRWSIRAENRDAGGADFIITIGDDAANLT